MSRLIWIYAICKSLLLSPVAVKKITFYFDFRKKNVMHEKQTVYRPPEIMLNASINLLPFGTVGLGGSIECKSD